MHWLHPHRLAAQLSHTQTRPSAVPTSIYAEQAKMQPMVRLSHAQPSSWKFIDIPAAAAAVWLAAAAAATAADVAVPLKAASAAQGKDSVQSLNHCKEVLVD